MKFAIDVEHLKPCPFCGFQARVYEENATIHVVECLNCGANLHAFGVNGRKYAIQRWNYRVNGVTKNDI